MFRSINFLIGILILLFVLITIGFSGTAFANTCSTGFDEGTPEYTQDSDYDNSQSDSEFIHETSAHFMEGSRKDNFGHTDEFDNTQENEFDHNTSF